MTPLTLLAELQRRDVELVPEGDRLRYRGPRGALSDDLRALVREHRDALRRLLVYRQALRRWWALTAQGPEADQAEVLQLHQEIIRLIDEVGEPLATKLRRQWAREWWQATGVCPFCGRPEPDHDPDRGGEGA